MLLFIADRPPPRERSSLVSLPPDFRAASRSAQSAASAGSSRQAYPGGRRYRRNRSTLAFLLPRAGEAITSWCVPALRPS